MALDAFRNQNGKHALPEVTTARDPAFEAEESGISHSVTDTKANLCYDEIADSCSQTLTDDELMLCSPVLYGFSLADKLWREYFLTGAYAPLNWVLR